jgi:hypothetical protein
MHPSSGVSAEAYESAKGILSSHRDQLERVAQELLRRETLAEQAFRTLLETRAPAAAIEPAYADGRPGNGEVAAENLSDARNFLT